MAGRAQAQPLLVDQKLGRYRIAEQIGAGGMGVEGPLSLVQTFSRAPGYRPEVLPGQPGEGHPRPPGIWGCCGGVVFPRGLWIRAAS